MRKATIILLLLSLLSTMGFSTVSAATDCAEFELGESQWGEFSGLLEENGIPSEAWASLAQGGIQLEDYGITPEQLNDFFTNPAAQEQINDMLNGNPTAELRQRGLEIMGAYGLGEGDIAPLLASRNDTRTLFATLAERGLDAHQADSFLAEIAPLVQEAAEKGLLKYATLEEAQTTLDQADGYVDIENIRHLLDDEEGLMTYFQDRGMDAELAENIVGDLMEIEGLEPDLVNAWVADSTIYQLEQSGVPVQSLDELVGFSGDPAALEDCLEAMGLDEDERNILAGSLDSLYGDTAFTDEDLQDYYVQELADFMFSTGATAEEVSELAGLDEDAQLEYLLSLGYEEADVDVILNLYDNSLFGRTLDAESLDEIGGDAEEIVTEFDDDYVSSFDETWDDMAYASDLEALTPEEIEDLLEASDDPEAFDELFDETVGTSDEDTEMEDDENASDDIGDEDTGDDADEDANDEDPSIGDDGSEDEGDSDTGDEDTGDNADEDASDEDPNIGDDGSEDESDSDTGGEDPGTGDDGSGDTGGEEEGES